MLRDHDFLIRLDPEFVSYETLPSDPARPKAKRYKVTDHMNALPKGLWDSTVTFESEMTDLEDGVLWIVKAPLGLVQTTTWKAVRTDTLASEVVEGTPASRIGVWSLFEEVEIKANRLLVGTVRAKCEENWTGAHAKFAEHVESEARKQ